MTEFLSSEINYSIFKRHLERKLIELGEDNVQEQRKILLFSQVSGKMNCSISKCVEDNQKNISELFSVNEMKSNIFEDSCGHTGAERENKCILTQPFSLFNDSPPMDLDESIISDDDIDLDATEVMHKYFIPAAIERREVMERVNEISQTDRLSVVLDGARITISECKSSRPSSLPVAHSWALIYLLCKHPDLSICTFSSKSLIQTILESCKVDLCLSLIQLNGVLAFLCDRPLIDLQLAYCFLNPGTSCRTTKELRLLVGKINVSTVIPQKDLSNLFDVYDRLCDQLVCLQSMDIYLYIYCSTNVVLAGLEYFGMDVDKNHWTQIQAQITDRLKIFEKEVIEAGGSLLCLNSPCQLREIIYCKLHLHEKMSEQQQTQFGIDHLIKARSTNEAVLTKFANLHPLPSIILKYRHINKTKSIYIDSFQSFIDFEKAVVRGSWDQSSSVTGRIYCSRPNLQALPRDMADNSLRGPAIDVKSIFSSSDDYTYVSADFSQIELRLYAHFANDLRLIGLFRKNDQTNEDIFTYLAKILGVTVSGTDNARQVTKRVIYSCLYGIGSCSLAETLAMSISEAKNLMRLVKEYLTGLETFGSSCVKQVHETGYLKTVTGRRRYFPIDEGTGEARQLEFRRQIMNFVIQGSAADICKVAMINCQRSVGSRSLEAKLILSRHDELVWRVNNDSLVEMIDIVYRVMSMDFIQYNVGGRVESIDLKVPMKVKVKKGRSLTELEVIEHLVK